MGGKRLKKICKASWLAEKLNLTLIGPDVEISKICSLNHIEDHSLLFSINSSLETERIVLVLGAENLARDSVTVLVSNNPRLDFAYALQILDENIGFEKIDRPPQIHPSAKIGKHVVIGRNVKIGEGTMINHHVVIGDDVEIGKYCKINSGAIIGEGDFGFERDETGRPIKILHLGSVLIGDYVQIGSLTSVGRGTIDNTIIGDYAKIDNHVYVSHNCKVEKNTIITGGAILGGSSVYGIGTWIGINSTIKQKVQIGDNALVGMGAVVLKDVETGDKVVGNPAKKLN